jgi:hypothetical protein
MLKKYYDNYIKIRNKISPYKMGFSAIRYSKIKKDPGTS